MVARQRPRRLCRRHPGAEPDAALPRAARRADRPAARPRAGAGQGRCDAARRRRRLSAVHQPLGQRRDRARRLPADRRLRARRQRAGVAVPLRRPRRRAPHLVGAGADTVYLAWRLVEGGPARLSVTLLANGRDHHGDTWPDGFRPAVAADGARLSVAAANRFTLAIVATAGEMAPGGEWYWDFDLPVERERGLGDRDAHLHVGDARLDLIPGEWAGLAASLAPNPDPDLAAALARRQAADRAVLDRARDLAAAPDWVRRLALASDLYLVARPLADLPNGRSVIAGYPWFGDWGRDTMIALPGLCLAAGRCDEARTILETFARFVDRGMLPNVFPESG